MSEKSIQKVALGLSSTCYSSAQQAEVADEHHVERRSKHRHGHYGYGHKKGMMGYNRYGFAPVAYAPVAMAPVVKPVAVMAPMRPMRPKKYRPMKKNYGPSMPAAQAPVTGMHARLKSYVPKEG
jgi:hypothetical protein